jgi:cation transport ATPase
VRVPHESTRSVKSSISQCILYYNVVAIPLAAGVLAPFGIVLAPVVGAVLMSASTVIVAINTRLLRRVRP